MLALLLFLAGDTPEKTFAEAKQAAAAKDLTALYDLIAPSDRKEMEAETEKIKARMAAPEGADELKGIAEMAGIPPAELLKLSARDLGLKMMAAMAKIEPEGYEERFGKFIRGAIQASKIDGDVCVLRVKHGERTEDVELAREGGRWYLSTAPERRASNERMASACLKTLATAQADFRANDRDGDRVNNFWAKDVAGLYGVEAGGESIRLIMIEIAEADQTEGRGKYASVKKEGPHAGYHFAALKGYREKGKATAYDDGKGRCVSRFGFVAWPAKKPGASKRCFLINEGNTVWWKDTGGAPPAEFPEDPAREGWKKLD